MQSISLIKGSSVKSQRREGAAEGTSEISWAIPADQGAKLPCGFGAWDAAVCEPKTLTYDEIILVLEGSFGVESSDGKRIEGQAGDVIEIRKGSTVRYFGSKARLFFVIH